MNIRQSIPSDLQAVYEIEKVCYGIADALPLIVLKQYQELCGAGFVVGDSASGLVGFAVGGVAFDDAGLGWILNVSVVPSSQGRGVGRSLCESLLATLISRGIQRIRATVSPDNTRSLAMLRRLGFETIDDIADYFGPGQKRMLMERVFTAASTESAGASQDRRPL